MAKSPITINDLARELNVAPSTVSRALNNSPKISDLTKQKIVKKAAELGYNLNMVASSLSRSRTNTIGVVIPFLNNFFYSEVVNGIEELAFNKGYRILIAQTRNSFDKEKEILRTMSATRVDGIIACLTTETTNTDHLKILSANDIPLVLFDRVRFDFPCRKVIIDNYSAMQQSVAHLARSGYKKIAHLGGPITCNISSEHAKAFKETLKREGLPLLTQFHLSTDLTEEDIMEAIKIWLTSRLKPDAIITATSYAALVVSKLIKEQKLSIPEDIALSSLTSEPALQFVEPQITSVALPGRDTGKTSMDYLLNEIEHKEQKSDTTIKPYQLIIRNSSFRNK
ncbi:LacI family DNA-binding transcriptional regulator [Marinilabilia salmonicolor]|uniref:LacI family DNA-binding transcriptional regulator n=1 Tax=Marinilabilia salmonicolor TaxID=989 RepID=UPI00029A39FA|nr:LacI family DNA-binding transcriptional regulator [Marinilabilia salmonicolor]